MKVAQTGLGSKLHVRALARTTLEFRTIFRPASRLEKLLEGLLGSSGGFGWKFPEGGADLLRSYLSLGGREISIRNPSKAKF